MTAETARINELRGDPGQLYDELCSITREMLPHFLEARALEFREDAQKELVHDAAVRLVERICRKGELYHFQHIRAVLYREIEHQVYDKAKVRWERSVVLIDPALPCTDRPAHPDDRHALAELLDDEDGRRVVLEIYFARTFSGLIRKLDTFKPRRWIYDNILAVESVYKNTRAMKCQERKRGHPTESRNISPLTRLLMRSFGSTSRIIQGRPLATL
jgi:hypothetical protein